MIELIQSIITKFLNLAEEIFYLVFGDVDFSVLWEWLPYDIGQAAASIIVILFAIALIRGIRQFLPF